MLIQISASEDSRSEWALLELQGELVGSLDPGVEIGKLSITQVLCDFSLNSQFSRQLTTVSDVH